MKTHTFFAILAILPAIGFSQNKKKQSDPLIQKVENSLAPNTIYADSLPNWNIETRMKETDIKGLSIAVIKDYKIAWAKGYGWADEESGRKVTTTTRFQAASISKSLNSMGVLKLVEQHILDPEADINNYLRSWKFPYDSVSKNKKINTYQLLSHAAGLSMSGFPGYERGVALPTVPQILDGAAPANTKAVRSIFEPGTQNRYSGGGTTITQLLVSDITGMAYADYMQKEVLTPLGMTNSSYLQPPVDTAQLATGYHGNGQPVKGKYHIYPEQAAAGLWTTPTDLAKYIIECQLALEGKSKKVLSQAMMQKRMTPYRDSTPVALGVFIEDKKGNKYFNHNGGNEAFLCTSFGSMSGGNGVVIMINGENFSIIGELLNSVARVYQWKDFYNPEFKKIVTVPADTAALYAGDYLLGLKDTLTIKFTGNQLAIQQNRQPANGYLLRFSDTRHFYTDEVPGAFFEIIYNKEGTKVEALELKQGGGTMRLKKL